ncbi:MAG: type II secretion system protein GspL [Gammaproteobacteria bacterium]|nr:type II secretion system protein GspL [Gammaproteobacteria bacterium]
MSETLVIRLRAAEDAPASWLIVDGNGARSGPVQTGPLADALNLVEGRSIVLLLPASEVVLAEPELPLRGGARLAQAVPFALEEQLASDVEALHCAVGSKGAGAVGTPVAVVSRGLIDRWHDAYEAAGIHPDAAYSDAAAVPLSPNGCTLLLDEGLLYVRRANSVPYALDANPLAAALDLALGEPTPGVSGADEAPAQPEHVTFFASPADYELHRDTIEGLRTRTATLHVKLLPDGSLPLLAAQAVGGAGVNLLQGPYAARSSLSARFRQWRLPAALAAAIALVFLAGQGLSIWHLRQAEKKLDAQIAQVFAAAMPGQKVVDPRAQLQGVLGNRGAGEGALLPVMSVLAQAMAQSPQARIEALSYRGNVLDLRLTAPSVEAIDAIKQAVSRDGVSAELQSATPRGQTVEGRLQVRLGKA